MLKDYVNGRLLFCHLRPDYERQVHGNIMQSGFKTHTTVGIPQPGQEEDDEETKEEVKGDEETEGDEEVSDGDFEEAKDQVDELAS